MMSFHERAQMDSDARKILQGGHTSEAPLGTRFLVHYRTRGAHEPRIEVFASATARAAWVVACGGYVEILHQSTEQAS